eukprot:2910300-Pyramimonas_sp.AAC.1
MRLRQGAKGTALICERMKIPTPPVGLWCVVCVAPLRKPAVLSYDTTSPQVSACRQIDVTLGQ